MALDFGKLNFSTSFNPTSAFPLDARCYFESLSAATTAVASAEEAGSSTTVYFFGQQIAVVENNIATLYIIEKVTDSSEKGYHGGLKEVGSRVTVDGNSIDIDATTGQLTVHGFADAANKQVASKDTTTGKIVWKDITEIIPGAVVPVSDHETIDVTQDSTDPNKYIVSIKGKSGAATDAVLRKHISGETVTYTWDAVYSKTEVDTLLNNKVDKETGKSLVLDTEITKLAGVSAGANKVEASTTNGNIKIDGVETQVYNDSQLASDIATESSRAQGVESGLDTRISNLEARGRFLSTWNATTGLPGDYPSIAVGETYAYKTGDYYLVNTVGTTNLKPSGSQIERTAESTWVVPSESETGAVSVGDEYLYTTSGWVLIHDAQKKVNWGNIGGTLSEQTDLQNALNAKQDEITSTNKLDADLVKDGTTNKVYTATEQTKLSGIEAGAQVNVLEGIQVAGTDVAIASKKSNVALGAGLAYNQATGETGNTLKLDLTNIILDGGTASN